MRLRGHQKRTTPLAGPSTSASHLEAVGQLAREAGVARPEERQASKHIQRSRVNRACKPGQLVKSAWHTQVGGRPSQLQWTGFTPEKALCDRSRAASFGRLSSAVQFTAPVRPKPDTLSFCTLKSCSSDRGGHGTSCVSAAHALPTHGGCEPFVCPCVEPVLRFAASVSRITPHRM
jgi:hypothetical protein